MGSPTSDGLGAFVRLDYNTNTEHAIVLMAKEWGSLKDFIATPGIFIENWRSKYGSTPDHKHLKFDSKIWELEGPITFIIEPLTVPTSSNAMTLASLDPLYPGLGAVARKWMTTTPEKFLNNVMAEISAPYTSWDTGETGYVAGMAPFTFAYIAEFAIKTRTITIKYIPRTDVNTPTYSHLDITSITVNHVKYTDLFLIHFDIAFTEKNHTRIDLAIERANFALDYLNDPSFINKVTQSPKAVPEAIEAAAPFYANHSTKHLPDNPYPPMRRPRIVGEGKRPYQPRLVIDSVWPDPYNDKYGLHLESMKELNDKEKEVLLTPPAWETQMPQLCVLLQALQATNQEGTYINGEYVTMEALIKAYAAPEPTTP